MGFNSVLIVLNDALHEIGDDSNFGAGVKSAVQSHDRRRNPRPDIMARGNFCTHANAATVVSVAHADCPQVVVVKHNTGWSAWEDDTPDHIINDLIAVLNHHGYSVKKKPTKATA